jgi:hypothetical protein
LSTFLEAAFNLAAGETLIIGSTTQQLIDGGYLSKFRAFAPASPDLRHRRRLTVSSAGPATGYPD